MCEGLPNKLICRELGIATGTVKVHISCILRELGATSRLQAVVAAIARGLGSIKKCLGFVNPVSILKLYSNISTQMGQKSCQQFSKSCGKLARRSRTSAD